MVKNDSNAEKNMELLKQMSGHEVAVAELNSLSSNRTVYQKHGNIYFRTTALKAKASEQKLLDATKAELNLNPAPSRATVIRNLYQVSFPEFHIYRS